MVISHCLQGVGDFVNGNCDPPHVIFRIKYLTLTLGEVALSRADSGIR